jgi:hypothetical protein
MSGKTTKRLRQLERLALSLSSGPPSRWPRNAGSWAAAALALILAGVALFFAQPMIATVLAEVMLAIAAAILIILITNQRAATTGRKYQQGVLLLGVIVGIFLLGWLLPRMRIETVQPPNLEGAIGAVHIVGQPGIREVLILLAVSITNHGTPSIVDDYVLTIQQPGLSSIRTTAAGVATPFPMQREPQNGVPGPTLVLCPSDSLWEKTLRGVGVGGQARGYLAFYAENINSVDLQRAAGTTYVLAFSDVNRQRYQATFTWNGEEMNGPWPTLPGIGREAMIL